MARFLTDGPQINSLDDIKSANQNDNNASKSMALEHLGVIAGRVRSNMLKNAGASGDKQETASKPLDEVSLLEID